MQSVSSTFTSKTNAAMRKLRYSVLMSFTKDYTDTIDFFTIGSSTIGGTDIIRGNDTVIQSWDQYTYTDYSDRVLSVEYEREVNAPLASLTLGIATVVMDNHDDLFTPGNTAGALYGYLLPRRPIRIAVGFGNETCSVFIGCTESRPIINESDKTARFECIDFLSAIKDKTLDQETIYQNQRTDQIIQSLLETAGLVASQMDLDTGSVIIPFAYFKKGSKLGDALAEIAEAELGNISLSETGRMTFQNRTNWSSHSSVWTFSKDNVLERKNSGVSDIINVCEVYSQARAVMAKQKLWESAGVLEIKGSSTLEVFIDFTDEYGALPVTTMDDPEYITSATTSKYATNKYWNGSGPTMSSAVSLTSSDLFSTAAKLVFTNTDSQSVFITQLEIYATPAKVQNDIYVRVQDDTSVGDLDAYEENVYKIENNYIQDETAANSIAQILISDRAEDDDQQNWLVKGVPQLQISDVVSWDETDQDDDFYVAKISGILDKSGFRQQLRVVKRTINSYFRIGIATIGGSDKIGP